MLDPKAASDALAPCADNQLEFVPKVTDFGLAKLLERDAARELQHGILGTPAYMAPGAGRRPVWARSAARPISMPWV